MFESPIDYESEGVSCKVPRIVPSLSGYLPVETKSPDKTLK